MLIPIIFKYHDYPESKLAQKYENTAIGMIILAIAALTIACTAFTYWYQGGTSLALIAGLVFVVLALMAYSQRKRLLSKASQTNDKEIRARVAVDYEYACLIATKYPFLSRMCRELNSEYALNPKIAEIPAPELKNITPFQLILGIVILVAMIAIIVKFTS